jgi:hypothetical protein
MIKMISVRIHPVHVRLQNVMQVTILSNLLNILIIFLSYMT